MESRDWFSFAPSGSWLSVAYTARLRIQPQLIPEFRQTLETGNKLRWVARFAEFTSNPSLWTNKFHPIWQQLATHAAAGPGRIMLELMNEPKDAATTPALNPIHAEAIRQAANLRSVESCVIDRTMRNAH